MLIEFIHTCGVPKNVGAHFMPYAEFFAYYGNLLLPFVCVGAIPELKKKIFKIFPCWQSRMNTVKPKTFISPPQPIAR